MINLKLTAIVQVMHLTVSAMMFCLNVDIHKGVMCLFLSNRTFSSSQVYMYMEVMAG